MDAGPPPSADAKPIPPPSAGAKKNAKKDADDDKRIAKIWADYGIAVEQLDGEPEEVAEAAYALFNATRLQAIAIKNPPVLETFTWCAANKNHDIRDVQEAFGLRLQSIESRENQPWPPHNPRRLDLPETASMFCSIVIDNPRQN